MRMRMRKRGVRVRVSVHSRSPREDLVLVAGDLESHPHLLQPDHRHVRQPLLPYRLNESLRHLSLSLVLE